MGPSIKYVTLSWPILTLLPPPHSFPPPHDPPLPPHPPPPPRPPPQFLLGLVQKSRTKVLCTNSISIVRGGFCPGVLSGLIFVRNPFCHNTSVTTES